MSWHNEHTERERLAKMADGRTATAEKLEALRDRYTNRRSIAWQFVEETLALVEQRSEELELAYTTASEAEREATKRAHRDEVVRLEKSRDEWKTMCQTAHEHLDERRTIRQELEQAAGADDSKVTISNGYVGWTVAGLEEVAYRLRTGGAIDETPVDVEKSRAVAMVPAPNLVQLDASPKAVPQRAAPAANPVVPDGGISFATALQVAAAVALVLIVLLVKLVIL